MVLWPQNFVSSLPETMVAKEAKTMDPSVVENT